MEALQAEDPTTIGPFQLLGRLGAGGMGRVYLGERSDIGFAAVKVVYESLASDASFRTRFAREVETARHVHGPWMASVLDADPDAAQPWLATEYVPGPSLEQAVAKSGALPEPALGVLASRLAEALARLHSLNVVHRDVKPSNVLLALDGPRLIDFGIARAVDATKITHTGIVVGTPAFMSPEQANDDTVGYPSDIFSLAGVLVFAASGRGPFGHTGNAASMLYRVTHEQPRTGEVVEWLRQELEPCLAKDPKARPTAAQLANRLHRRTESPNHWPPPTLIDLLPHAPATSARTATRVDTVDHIYDVARPALSRKALLIAIGGPAAILVIVLILNLIPSPNSPRELSWTQIATFSEVTSLTVTPDSARILSVEYPPTGGRTITVATPTGAAQDAVTFDQSSPLPREIISGPTSGRAYVMVDSPGEPTTLRSLDLATLQVGDPLATLDPASDRWTFSRNGQYFLTWDFSASGQPVQFNILDTTSGITRHVTAALPSASLKLAITDDGTRAFVVDTATVWGRDPVVRSIDLRTGSITPITIEPEVRDLDCCIPGFDLRLSKDGERLYAPPDMTRHGASDFAIINTRSNTVERRINFDHDPIAFEASPSGRYIYALSHDLGKGTVLRVIDANTDEVVADASIAPDYRGVYEIVLAPDGQSLYLYDGARNTPGVIRVETGDFA